MTMVKDREGGGSSGTTFLCCLPPDTARQAILQVWVVKCTVMGLKKEVMFIYIRLYSKYSRHALLFIVLYVPVVSST